MKIGAQMFTTRATCQTLEGFADTLKRIADIGYTTVQVSGTCPYEGEWLRDQLKLNGLKCVLTHIPVPRLDGRPLGRIENRHAPASLLKTANNVPAL